MNVITIIGRVGRDPESRTTADGKTVVKFSVAVNRRGKEDATDWFEVQAFGRLGEVMATLITKGRQVAVSGSLRIDEWIGQDGVKRKSVGIYASDIQLLDKRPDGQPSQPPAAPRQQPKQPAWDTGDEDDIPPF